MLGRIRKLRTNENVLIAIDTLYHSKSSFMNVFLMAFMMRVSLSDSPIDFLIYNIIKYAATGISSILLMDFIRKHTLAAWRISMVFSVLQIITILILGGNSSSFIYVLAVIAALESTLYWRPKVHYDVAEVTEDRRVRYITFGQTLNEVGKIIMPTILGILIGENGYKGAAGVIFAIAVFELLLSILFRPTKHTTRNKGHGIAKTWKYMQSHKSLRKLLVIQLLRGCVVSGAFYIVISQFNAYRVLDSDTGLGFYTSLASGIAVVALWAYRKYATNYNSRVAVSAGVMPAIILLPLCAWLMPDSKLIAISLYIIAQCVVELFFSIVVVHTRIQSIIKQHIKDDAYRVEAESIGELFLSVGRVFSLGVVLLILSLGHNELIMPYMTIASLLIIPLFMLSKPSRRGLKK